MRKKIYNKYIRFNEILSELKKKGYTDTIVIDLSCAAGWTDREGRILTRQNKKEKIKYGGKKRTKKVKKCRGGSGKNVSFKHDDIASQMCIPGKKGYVNLSPRSIIKFDKEGTANRY